MNFIDVLVTGLITEVGNIFVDQILAWVLECGVVFDEIDEDSLNHV